MDSLASLGLAIDSKPAATASEDLDRFSESAERAQNAAVALEDSAAGAGEQFQKIGEGSRVLAAEQSKAATALTDSAGGARALATQATSASAALERNAATLASYRAGVADLREELFGARAPLAAVGEGVETTASSLIPFAFGLTAAAAAAALLFQATREGQREMFEFDKAIVLSGNAAGVTAGNLAVMANQIDRVAGTRSEAAAALTAAVSTARVTAGALQQIAQVAVQLEHTVGEPVEKTIKAFASLGDKPTEAAEKLQRQYGFLTAAVYDQIRALEKQGNVDDAARVAQDAFASAMQARVSSLEPRLGLIERGWRSIKDAAAEAWDAMLNIGRSETPEEELQRLFARNGFLNGQIKAGNLVNAGTVSTELEGNNDRIAVLNRLTQAQFVQAKGEADAVRAANEHIAAEDRLRKLEEVRANALNQNAAAQLRANQGGVQRELDASLAAYDNYGRLLEAQRDAQLISETQYFDERRTLIERDTAARVKALETENRLIAADSERIRAAARNAADRAEDPVEKEKAILAIGPQIIANQDRIRDNENAIAIIRGNAIEQTTELGIAETQSNLKVVRSYELARAAAESYLDTLKRRQNLELEGFGKGQRQRDFNAGRSDIAADFERQRQDLAADRRREQITKEQYEQQLDIVNEFQSKALDAYDDYYDQLTEKQGSFYLGATEALHNYADESKNTAAQVSQALSSGFDRATDALVKFVTTGKGNFKQLANSIIADLLRIQLQKSLTSVLSSAFGSIFGAFSGTNFSGAGVTPPSGNVLYAASGTNYVERDNQPAILHKGEAVVPRAFNPSAGGSGWGGARVNVNQEFHFAAGADVAQFMAAGEQIKQATKAEIIEDIGRGRWNGILAKAAT